jgi:hypothetical protein
MERWQLHLCTILNTCNGSKIMLWRCTESQNRMIRAYIDIQPRNKIDSSASLPLIFFDGGAMGKSSPKVEVARESLSVIRLRTLQTSNPLLVLCTLYEVEGTQYPLHSNLS